MWKSSTPLFCFRAVDSKLTDLHGATTVSEGPVRTTALSSDSSTASFPLWLSKNSCLPRTDGLRRRSCVNSLHLGRDRVVRKKISNADSYVNGPGPEV